MYERIKTRLLAGAASLTAAFPVYAQDAGENGEGAFGRDEIIVTTRFREESIQDIGASVTGISGDDLREQGLSDIDDIARVGPACKASRAGRIPTTLRYAG